MLDKPEVLACYAEALAAIGSLGSRVSDWEAPTPCGSWTARDLAGHLLAIARYYHRLLDASGAGQPLAGLPRGADLAAMNARDLADLEVDGGTERVELYCELAEELVGRLRQTDWDEILGTWSGLGDLTVGQHTGIAIGEWHVHAWDLARASGGEHRPSDPATVKAGQRVLDRAIGAGDPWIVVLGGYERDPGWSPSA